MNDTPQTDECLGGNAHGNAIEYLARELEREIARLQKIEEAAKCIRHWHDAANSGMVVSGVAVRALWAALANIASEPRPGGSA